MKFEKGEVEQYLDGLVTQIRTLMTLDITETSDICDWISVRMKFPITYFVVHRSKEIGFFILFFFKPRNKQQLFKRYDIDMISGFHEIDELCCFTNWDSSNEDFWITLE